MQPAKQIPQGETSPNPFTAQRSGRMMTTTAAKQDAKVKETCKTWAHRTDLSIYTNGEVSTAYAAVLRSSQALEPYYSTPRTAYRKLLAEMHRRRLDTVAAASRPSA
jgi:hypothetical protein